MKVLHSICTIFAPMKAKNILILILGTLILPIYLTSCGVDRWKEYAGQTQTDRWIDDTMRVWYYWVDAIPHTNDLNYFQAPFTFFASLKSEEDKFSTIDSLVSVTTTRSIPYTDYSYGFQFTTNQIEVEGEDNAIVAQILYVADGSPASEIGLKRGDWIMKMDGNFITEQNYKKLYGSSAMELTVGYYDVEKNAIVAYDKPRQIASARPVNDNPVHYKNVYTSGSKKIGYLVYNHFSSGPTDNSNEYDNDLRSAFQYFASQQVNEFILDLRYNNGGLLSCAELLCTMLAPSSALGQELGYLEFNNRFNPQIVPFTLNSGLIGNGEYKDHQAVITDEAGTISTYTLNDKGYATTCTSQDMAGNTRTYTFSYLINTEDKYYLENITERLDNGKEYSSITIDYNNFRALRIQQKVDAFEHNSMATTPSGDEIANISEIPSLFITDMYPLSMHAVAIYGKILGEPANYLITQLIPDSNGESEETTTYTYTLDNRGIVTSCHAVVRHIRNGYEQDYTRAVNYTIE